MKPLREFIRFSRPHTVIGTTLSIVVLYLIATNSGTTKSNDIFILLATLLSCLGSNIFIVGLNQITDVEIDKINKPYLPLASGAYSMPLAKRIVGVSVVMSLLIAMWAGPYLLITVILSLILGTAYSLPPVRLKRFHFWAAFCIIAVRGLIVNLLLFVHFNYEINGEARIVPLVGLLTAIIFVYSVVIAWFKDMPDLSGDQVYGIRTLSLQIGTRQVFRIGNAFMGVLFAIVIALPYFVDFGVSKLALSSAHIFIACLLGIASRYVDFESSSSLFKYYQFIWVLFFLEYIVFGSLTLG